MMAQNDRLELPEELPTVEYGYNAPCVKEAELLYKAALKRIEETRQATAREILTEIMMRRVYYEQYYVNKEVVRALAYLIEKIRRQFLGENQ